MMLNAGFIVRLAPRANRSPADGGAGEAGEPALEQRSGLVRTDDGWALARRKIAVHGIVAELRQKTEAAPLGGRPRYGGIRVVEVAEHARVRRAGEHAGGLPIFGRQQLVVDAIDAQRALLHRVRCVVELARTVWTGPGAQVAAH